MLRKKPNLCHPPYLHSGEHGSFPLATFAVNRWLRRKAHIVFVFQTMGMLSSEFTKHTYSNMLMHRQKHKPSVIYFNALVKLLSNSISKKKTGN